MTILTQSQRDEIEKRHESTLLIDWEQEFNPEAQPQSLSNALYCHQDRGALLASEQALRERLERVRGLIDKWETDYHPVEPYDSAHTFIRDLEQALEQDE